MHAALSVFEQFVGIHTLRKTKLRIAFFRLRPSLKHNLVHSRLYLMSRLGPRQGNRKKIRSVLGFALRRPPRGLKNQHCPFNHLARRAFKSRNLNILNTCILLGKREPTWLFICTKDIKGIFYLHWKFQSFENLKICARRNVDLKHKFKMQECYWPQRLKILPEMSVWRKKCLLASNGFELLGPHKKTIA